MSMTSSMHASLTWLTGACFVIRVSRPLSAGTSKRDHVRRNARHLKNALIHLSPKVCLHSVIALLAPFVPSFLSFALVVLVPFSRLSPWVCAFFFCLVPSSLALVCPHQPLFEYLSLTSSSCLYPLLFLSSPPSLSLSKSMKSATVLFVAHILVRSRRVRAG